MVDENHFKVNELETSYDTWLDYPVGEKKERYTPFHYHVLDFLLQLADNPTGANEIQNPKKKNVMDFSSDEEELSGSSNESYKEIKLGLSRAKIINFTAV